MRRLPFLPSSNSGGAPEWAVTYGDMMSLLLVFFVLIASYSNMDVIKYRALIGSIQQAFGTRDRIPAPVELEAARSTAIASEDDAGGRVEEDLEELVDQSGPGGPIQVLRSTDGLRVRIEGQMIFAPAESGLRPEALPLLRRLGPILARHPYRIWVEGHTDDLPIRTPAFPSNWELSAARAGSVVRELIENGGVPPDRLAAVGYAATRPLQTNATEEGRARNRRVELLLRRVHDPTP